MVANGYSKQIRERIDSAADGTIFVNSDFVDVTDPETVRRNLNRLTQAGILRRILKGVFYPAILLKEGKRIYKKCA